MTGAPSPAGTPRSVRRWVRGRLLHGLAPLTVALAVGASAMAGVCTWQARDASRSSQQTARETALSQAYQDIDSAVNREYSAQLRYLSADRGLADGGSQAQITQFLVFTRAQSDLRAAVERVKSLGDVDDKALAAFVLVEDRQYTQNARTVFAAVKAGEIAQAQRLATTITGPRVDALISRVSSAAAAHTLRSQDSMTRLTQTSQWAAVAIPASFGLALLLLGACWVILLQLNKAVRYQASALFAEKQLLSTVIETSPYFVYWKDETGHYLGTNQAFERLTRSCDPPGADPDDAGGQGLIRRLLELEQQVQVAGVAAIDQQATVRSPDGRERRLLFSVLPRPGQEGPEGVIGVGVDVTRLTDLERQLAITSRLESVGRLAAGLAHEINTPVQVLTSNTHFIAESTEHILSDLRRLHELSGEQELDIASMRALIGDLDTEYLQNEIPRALSDTREGLQRVAGLVQAMKDFARGGQDFGPCRLNDAVRSVVEISRHEWKAVADLRLNLDPAVQIVNCHEGEIKESLLAMVMNAVQAVAEKGGQTTGAPWGTIDVSTHAEPDGVRIIVQDNGIGMDEAVRRRVFDPFFTTRVAGQSSGQGLHFAYGAVVVHHGGTIDISSAPGEGSTFTITLPDRPLDAQG